MRANTWGLLLALCGGVAMAGPPETVAEVQRLFDDLEVEAASKLADATVLEGGLDRANYLKLCALQGLARATLNRGVPARDAFYRLLLLEPGYTLPANQPPRVKAVFFEAKGMATENGPVTIEPTFAVEDGKVSRLTVTVLRDVLRLAKAAQFTVSVDGVERAERVDLVDGVASLPVSGARVRWSVAVLADRDNVVLEAGTGGTPLEAAGVAPPVSPAVAAGAPPASSAGAWKRPVGIGLLAAGAAAGVAGAVFGARANELRAQLTGATRNEAGAIVGLTQREAFAMDQQAQSSALAANVLFVSAGVVAAAGLGLVLWSLGDPVRVSPAAGGVVVSGTF